jgi:hypothetical protein
VVQFDRIEMGKRNSSPLIHDICHLPSNFGTAERQRDSVLRGGFHKASMTFLLHNE